MRTILITLLLSASCLAQSFGGMQVSSSSGTTAGGTNVKTSGYTIIAGDNSKMVVFNCSTACTATLTASATLGASFFVKIVSIGADTVTIASSDTINGAKTLLPGMYADVFSTGSAFYSARNTSTYNCTQTATQSGDKLTNPGGGTNTRFASKCKLFANLPVGTRIFGSAWGRFATSATKDLYIDVRLDNGTGARFCSGDVLQAGNSGSNSWNWSMFCDATVYVTGASGAFWPAGNQDVWVQDQGRPSTGSVAYTIHALQVFPEGTPGESGFGTNTTGVTFDSTTAHDLVIGYDSTDDSNSTFTGTLIMNKLGLTFSLPVDQ